MKNKTIIWLIGGISGFIILAVIIFVAAFYSLFIFSLNRVGESAKKRTAETVGTMTDFSETVDTSQPPSVSTKLHYEFVVDGKRYEARTESSKSVYLKGKKVKVCYEPSNPENSDYHLDENKICGEL